MQHTLLYFPRTLLRHIDLIFFWKFLKETRVTQKKIINIFSEVKLIVFTRSGQKCSDWKST